MILMSSCEWSDTGSHCNYIQEDINYDILMTHFLAIILMQPGRNDQCLSQKIN